MRHLKADSHYVWFTLIISLILIIVFYRFTHKLGMSITKLQQFAMKADRNEPIDTDMQDTFPKNELGEYPNISSRFTNVCIRQKKIYISNARN